MRVVFSQSLAVPYLNTFDNPGDTLGWSHYAITGSDDWQMGVPNDYYFNTSISSPNVWATYLTAGHSYNSSRALETPYFDLTDTTQVYYFSFFQERHDPAQYSDYFVEYTIDGINWLLLDDVNAQKKNWQSTTGFHPSVSQYVHSTISIDFIQGQDSVKFRFLYNSGGAYGEGWMIDHFSIESEELNISAHNGDTINVSQNCLDYTVVSKLGLYSQFPITVYNTTEYYFSEDNILDASDSLISVKQTNISGTVSAYSQTLLLDSNLNSGYYYIIYKHDALDTLSETNEGDNIGYAVLIVDSVYSLPYIEDFESSSEQWVPSVPTTNPVLWELGKGRRHHIENAHSGVNAWHTSNTLHYTYYTNIVKSPYMNLASDTALLVCNLWYKRHGTSFKIQYSHDCDVSWNDLSVVQTSLDDDWDFFNARLDAISSYENIRFRISTNPNAEGMVFDDFYIGRAKPDISIERDKKNRYSLNNNSEDTIKYYLFNSGLDSMPQTTSAFYWSTDSILDVSDVFLGSKQELAMNDTSRVWTEFAFSKPTLASGKYYIIYILDSANIVDEMREYNNQGFFTVYQQDLVQTPYYNDFETDISGWRHNASLNKDDWQWTSPKGVKLDTAFSGTKVWITNDTGQISTMSRMHLYTPVFDLSTTTNPVLEFDAEFYNINTHVNMSYSIDGGANWIVLDTTSTSFNRWYYSMWYNSGNFTDNTGAAKQSGWFFNLSEKAFYCSGTYNGKDVERNTRYSLDISSFSGIKKIQFRFNVGTYDDYGCEGIMIDNFSIQEAYIDLCVPYKRALMISSLSEEIKFYLKIKNQGNFNADSCNVRFYLSSDTILNITDSLLGEETTPIIRTDHSFYFNLKYNSPNNLSQFKYLLYEIDVNNDNVESNELNNIGYWPLALDSISTYPYFCDFNDTILDSWHHYSHNRYGNHIKNGPRFRNFLVPGDYKWRYDYNQGEIFSDSYSASSMESLPFVYLESPAFDFSGYDSLFLSFDLIECYSDGCSTTSYDNGGNFHYSIDGGNNWTVLDAQYGETFNWFNCNNIHYINEEPGWSGQFFWSYDDSTSYDISFLKGKENVVFRFQFRAEHSTYGVMKKTGLVLDNFNINAYQIDYIAQDTSFTQINAIINQPTTVNYSIYNNGEIDGPSSITKFYWSTDSILDSGDQLIHAEMENKIPIGVTYSSSADINFPPPTYQKTFYLFYITDGDSTIIESKETNNIGCFRVEFSDYLNYYANINNTLCQVV
jgi:hypothetical protein